MKRGARLAWTSTRMWAVIGGITAIVFLAGVAQAENAWIKGEVRLNLRTGPGNQFRIISGMTTGDAVTVIERGSGWTKIRKQDDGQLGWIPEGYLQPKPPPTVAVAMLEDQVSELTSKLEATTSEAAALRTNNEELAGRDGDQRTEIEQLTLEVMELSAGARWPEWITGASILLVGMLVGAILHRNSTRRPSSRIRI
jgi:hypothetical protein